MTGGRRRGGNGTEAGGDAFGGNVRVMSGKLRSSVSTGLLLHDSSVAIGGRLGMENVAARAGKAPAGYPAATACCSNGNVDSPAGRRAAACPATSGDVGGGRGGVAPDPVLSERCAAVGKGSCNSLRTFADSSESELWLETGPRGRGSLETCEGEGEVVCGDADIRPLAMLDVVVLAPVARPVGDWILTGPEMELIEPIEPPLMCPGMLVAPSAPSSDLAEMLPPLDSGSSLGLFTSPALAPCFALKSLR